MRKPISIILTFVFIFNIGGYYLWFGIELLTIHNQIKREIVKGLRENDLTLVIVPLKHESGINWVESGNEFSYKGEMFDVVRTKVQGKNMCYYCIKDIKEKQLIANNLKSSNSKKDAEKRIKRILGNTYFTIQPQFLKFLDESDYNYIGYQIHYSPICTDNPNPPPKSV